MPSSAHPARGDLEQARAALRAGDPARAERHYQAALRTDGNNVEVLYEASMVNAHLGRLEASLALVERALVPGAGVAQLHFHRGELLAALRRTGDAIEAYGRALAIEPNHLDVLNNLADSLVAMERMDDALPLLERALALKPDFVPALNNRANFLKFHGRTAEAMRDLDRAVDLSDGDPHVLFNRSGVLLTSKRYAEAESDCRRILAKATNHIGALFNLGKALAGRGKFDEALATSDTLIALQPGNPMAWSDRGSLLAGMGRHKEAWACLDKALTIEPDLGDAWFASGLLYSSFLQHEAALKCFRRSFVLQPNNAEASCSLSEALRRIGRDEEALAAFQETLRIRKDYPFVRAQVAWLKLHRCNWEGVQGDIDATLHALRDGHPVGPPLDLMTMAGGAEDQLRCAQTYVAHVVGPRGVALWQGEQYRNPRIRIAYLSADFREHPVSNLIAGLLEQHDRSRLEIFGFSLQEPGPSELAARVAGAFDQFIVVKEMSDREIGCLLRERQIDIAVDLMGHTTFARTAVFALRPCPVQVNYLGYPGSAGTDFHDYIIADAQVIPPGMERHYSEKVVRLPDTFQCNDSKRGAAAQLPSRADVGLPPDGVIYCCFNNSAKISPAVFDAWMTIMREVTGSVLWLFAEHPILQGNLRKEAQARGIDPRRLVLAPHVKYPEHLARLSLADVFLDTLPFNAGTTASDALWAGVPVVTRPGEAFAARMAASLVHAIGMPELITSSKEEYVALAVRLGREPEFLAATKAALAANRLTKPLFDTDRFRRHLEAAYVAMWERTQRGEPPADITVAAVS